MMSKKKQLVVKLTPAEHAQFKQCCDRVDADMTTVIKHLIRTWRKKNLKLVKDLTYKAG